MLVGHARTEPCPCKRGEGSLEGANKGDGKSEGTEPTNSVRVKAVFKRAEPAATCLGGGAGGPWTQNKTKYGSQLARGIYIDSSPPAGRWQ